MIGKPLKLDEIEIDYKKVKTNSFNCEKDLEEFIINHIKEFCTDILEDELVSFETEYQFIRQYKLSPRDRRVDIYITGKKKKYIIKLKNPTNLAENRYAIGQLLDYGREFLDPEKEMILITTKFDINTAKTIKYYNLPIRYIYLDKKKYMEYIKDQNE